MNQVAAKPAATVFAMRSALMTGEAYPSKAKPDRDDEG
jgi:hypothetical protein